MKRTSFTAELIKKNDPYKTEIFTPGLLPATAMPRGRNDEIDETHELSNDQ